MTEPAALAAAAAPQSRYSPVQRRAALRDAVTRVAQGHARVLVLGEAKRGKSTLVNALFGTPLLPTGVLPLTSVTTVVAVGAPARAEVRYRDGTHADIALSAVAELVSEKGNPGNERGVDRVIVTAPCDFLPPGTEVVDTPGTGSVNLANTDEARRALSTRRFHRSGGCRPARPTGSGLPAVRAGHPPPQRRVRRVRKLVGGRVGVTRLGPRRGFHRPRAAPRGNRAARRFT